jgi:hypothetical protein
MGAKMRPLAPTLLALILLAGSLGLAGAADAQPTAPFGGQAGVRPATPSHLERVAPSRGLPVEQERDPGRGPAPHEPVFLASAATTTDDVRFALSAWIAPGPPFDHRENPGGPAVGLTVTWPGPTSGRPAAGPSPWRGSAAR